MLGSGRLLSSTLKRQPTHFPPYKEVNMDKPNYYAVITADVVDFPTPAAPPFDVNPK